MIQHFMILRKDGQPLYIHGETDCSHEMLIGGFLSSFEIFAGNLHQSHINKIELDNYTYFYSVRDPIISVVEAIPSNEMESRMYQILSERLARKFLLRHPKEEVCAWAGQADCYTAFTSDYEESLRAVQEMLHQSHKEFITKYFVEAARDENILGTVVFDLDKDEILASDIPEDLSVTDFEAFGSMLFSFVNRLSITLKAGGIDEILIRAKHYWIGGFKKQHFAVFMLFNQNYFGQVIPDFVKDALPKST